ncbi:7 transmembrane receptor (secretin family) domain-containing protein [Hirsutella rhossiliensis]|uniref:7 transmembrane receptor (Secretin family) domain-containing protein n=1 Tax=Hirsutella rhossiliensis TaxID=111463 RepID=A0A9P8MYS7_9HYPO|nr:7 transmembrane receptor (Secretin family) domain-containing protein [Hirsutella rhossiliensis]KAH0962834.1 7 transmembrane receptor (Secretin family) domain-containing protein [Hirsutella rhossiliensis]
MHGQDASHGGHDSSLTPDEIKTLITIERTGAGLSMVAIALTLLSFVVFKKLRTTPNLFLVFASVANAGASVASMMGYDGLRQGQDSALCQAQAFIFEWFMQSDPWWSFAMAFNVYLVFFYNADPASFRKYLWAYCLVCFGGPMIPAVVLIAIRGDPRGPIYGDAALWCWIGPSWSLVRLYSYYIPIWICILLSFVIYAAVGYQVFHHRNQLLSISLHNRFGAKDQREPSRAGSGGGDSAEEDVYGTVITEVQVTSALPTLDFAPSAAAPIRHTSGGLPYSSSWTSGLHGDSSSFSPRPQRYNLLGPIRAALGEASLKLKRLDPVKMAYLRTSFIFGFAVLITWIPSSVNRLYSLANGGRISFSLSVASGCVLPLQGVWNAIIYLTTS